MDAKTISHHATHEPGAGTYVAIWALLMVLTAATVAVAYIDFHAITIIVCLAIAAVKSVSVLLYFMHLRYESGRMIRFVIPLAVVVLALFIGLTFSDVFTR